VVGATYPAELARVRELAPSLPLLIPGVGAQGGDAAATVQAGWRGNVRADGAGPGTTGPIMVNSSRAVLYASACEDFAQSARRVAEATRQQLNAALPV
jgi:orotidine-5'-phosphate decarboxylase